MAKKPTPNAQAFDLELKRIQRLVKTAEKKGIVFLSSPVPEKPERVTKKSLDLIKSVTSLDIESKGFTLNKDTGELTAYIPDPKQTARPHKKSAKRFTPDDELHFPHYPKPDPRLSPEELHRRRVEQGRRLAQHVREREASDPEFAKHLKEVRKKALERGRVTRKKWLEEHPTEAHEMRSKAAKKAAVSRAKHEAEDPEYGERMRQIRAANLEKARWAKKLKKIDSTDDNPFEGTDYSPFTGKQESKYPAPEDMPTQEESVIETLRNILSSASSNANVSNYLMQLLDDEIDLQGTEEVGSRLVNAPEYAIEMATAIQYDSDNDKLQEHAYALADLILGGSVPAYVAQSIEELAWNDIPYRRKSR